MTAAARPPGWWRCRATRADGTTAWFATVWSPDRPDGAEVDLDEVAATAAVGDDAVCLARCDTTGRVTHLAVRPLVAPKAPPLWFLELRESASTPPAVHLVAFTGHAVEPGQLLDDPAAREVGVTTGDQLGALRWYPGTGEVDQVFVAPAWRRRSIGSALTAAGTTLATVRGWARLWGDGQRTDLGERWRNASAWSHRTADLTHIAPPMDPSGG